jgi:hypothetical protein
MSTYVCKICGGQHDVREICPQKAADVYRVAAEHSPDLGWPRLDNLRSEAERMVEGLPPARRYVVEVEIPPVD